MRLYKYINMLGAGGASRKMGAIGAAAGGVVSLAGGMLAAGAAKEGLREINKQSGMAIDLYNRANSGEQAIINEDPTQNAENQAARTNMMEATAQAAKQAQAAAAIAGGDPNLTQQIVQAGSASAAKMAQQASVDANARKERARGRIASNNSGIASMRQYIGNAANAAAQAKAQAISGAANGLASAANSIPW